MELGADQMREYESRCATLIDLGPVAERLIQELLRAADLRVHSVRHRVKSKESLRRKVGRKGAAYEDLDDVHDLLGLRVITLFPDEVDRVAEVIEAEFTIDEDNSVDKRSLLDPDRFGYLSIHYVATLDDDRSQLTEHERFDGIKFEIQIRSILQHVWAEIEHDLGYQTAAAIPRSVRRRFSRLAGLLEIADDEFQTLRNEISDYQSEVDKEISESPDLVQIDQDSIEAIMRSSSALFELDRYIANALGGELIEDVEPAAGVLARELQWVGMENVAQVAEALDEEAAHIRAFVDCWAPRIAQIEGYLNQGLGLFYLCYIRVAKSESIEHVVSYLEDAGIELDSNDTPESVAREILETDSEARRILEAPG